MVSFAKYRVLFFLFIIVAVLSGTFLAIKFTQGYRIDLSSKTIKPTGLLVINSTPPGAQVYVDGKLMTATNNTLALPPGKYYVELKKNGFFSWQKNLNLEKELVTQAEAFLFPQIPDLKPLTYHATQNPELSPDGTRVVYSIPLELEKVRSSTASASAVDLAGLWIMDLTDSLFNLGREPRQIVKSPLLGKDFSKAKFGWSLDGKQIWVEFSESEKYLLDPNTLNLAGTIINQQKNWTEINIAWEEENKLRSQMKMNKYPKLFQAILASNSAELSFSPDGTKILYQATASAQIPDNLIPPVLASSTQKQERNIEKGKYYVYDLKEDKNFLVPYTAKKPTPTPSSKKKVPTPTPSYYSLLAENYFSPRWFPTSQHLYWIDTPEDSEQDSPGKVIVCEYDGNNLTAVYSGPFMKPFVYASPNANKLIILTHINFNEEAGFNLYAVSLR